MPKTLHIATDLDLPLQAVVQTLAAIGRKGAGKTYLATMIAEQMLDAGAQVVALDPVGNWYGLRIAADGKGPGKGIFVMGGANGDVPLTPEAGAKVARLIVERNISAVLDVSEFRQGERKRFAADFGEELFHLKKTSRTAVHLFIEEAQLFAPQRPGPEDARMLGAFEHIVRLGRNYGIGCTLVTQRPQSVNKEVLSQVECLCVLQVNGTHERKALEEWVQERGADRKLIGELPGLSQGEGYVWSPSWLRIFKRVRFSKKATFDASATPEVGKAQRTAKLSAVDVEELRGQMAEIIEKAKADDPKELRKELTAARRAAEILAEERDGLRKRAAERDTWSAALTQADARIAELEAAPTYFPAEMLSRLAGVLEALKAIVEEAQGPLSRKSFEPYVRAKRFAEPVHPPAERPARLSRSAEKPFAEKLREVRPELAAPARAVPKGEAAILTAAAQYPAGVDREQLTVLTGYKRSSRDSYIQRLRASGFLAELGDGKLGATPAGVAALGEDFEPLPTGKRLRDFWLGKLPTGELRILERLFEVFPHPLSRDALSAETGYKRSSRDSYLQRLSARKLIETSRDGFVKASPELFR